MHQGLDDYINGINLYQNVGVNLVQWWGCSVADFWLGCSPTNPYLTTADRFGAFCNHVRVKIINIIKANR